MKKNKNTFYCFSPPVMVATFLLEFGLLAYTVYRYKMTPITRIVAAILFFLAVFQIAEYNVCENDSAAAAGWSRLGFVAITILPPLAIHLITHIANKKHSIITALAYAMSAFFVLFFGFSELAFKGHECAGNYAIFQMNRIGSLYFVYYYMWLVIGIFMSLYYSFSVSAKKRNALILQAMGYLSFLLPTMILNTVNPETINGIPSIMCGFAVVYAVLLVIGIVPLTALPKHRPKKLS